MPLFLPNNTNKTLNKDLLKTSTTFDFPESRLIQHKITKRLIMKKNTVLKKPTQFNGIPSHDKPKTPKYCHKTQRIVYRPRMNTKNLPLVIINFEGVLGEVYQDSSSEYGQLYYFIKPRIIF